MTLTVLCFFSSFSLYLFFWQRKKDQVRELFESRARAEDDAVSARTPHNRLHVSSLVELLKERCQDQDIMMVNDGAESSTTTTMATDMATKTKKLAVKYGMDVEMLEKLVRSVNVPSEGESGTPLGGVGAGASAGAGRYVRDAEGGENIVVREVSYFLYL